MEHFMHMEKIRVDATPKAFSTESSVVIVAARPIRWSAETTVSSATVLDDVDLGSPNRLPGRADDRIDLKLLPLKEREVLTCCRAFRLDPLHRHCVGPVSPPRVTRNGLILTPNDALDRLLRGSARGFDGGVLQRP